MFCKPRVFCIIFKWTFKGRTSWLIRFIESQLDLVDQPNGRFWVINQFLQAVSKHPLWLMHRLWCDTCCWNKTMLPKQRNVLFIVFIYFFLLRIFLLLPQSNKVEKGRVLAEGMLWFMPHYYPAAKVFLLHGSIIPLYASVFGVLSRTSVTTICLYVFETCQTAAVQESPTLMRKMNANKLLPTALVHACVCVMRFTENNKSLITRKPSGREKSSAVAWWPSSAKRQWLVRASWPGVCFVSVWFDICHIFLMRALTVGSCCYCSCLL